MPLNIGAHMPISGGLHKAIERIQLAEGHALQIFTRNQRQWKVPELRGEEIHDFFMARMKWGEYPIIAHDSYLVNLASPKGDLVKKSIEAMAAEMQRVDGLDIPILVTHPGAHIGQGIEQGLTTYAANLDRVIELSETKRPDIMLETTAGQGTVLGSRFEELARIMELSKHPRRLYVCLDTCHAFAAGYDFRTEQAYEKTMAEFDRIIGLERLAVLHLNDSKHGLGSRKDRHEHIGQGELGDTAFSLFVNDPRLQSKFMIIETPKDAKDKLFTLDKNNIARLRNMAAGRG